MKIEDLVPPLEICKQIPEGKFADSALVWLGERVYIRSGEDAVTFPAPTLEEILMALGATGRFEMAGSPDTTGALKTLLETWKEAAND